MRTGWTFIAAVATAAGFLPAASHGYAPPWIPVEASAEKQPNGQTPPISHVSGPTNAARDGQAAASTKTAAAKWLSPRDKQKESTSHALPPPGTSSTESSLSPAGSLVTVFGSLAVVVGLFLIGAWMLRKMAPAGSMALPSEALEVLGRGLLSSKLPVCLARCGGKLLLVSLAGDGPRTLAEITDPDEVARLLQLCKQTRDGGGSPTFKQVFQQLGGMNATARGERRRRA